MKEKKSPIQVLTAVLTLALLGIAVGKGAEYYQVQETMAQTAENWGLGFPKGGGQPTGNATPEQLRQYDAYYIGDTTNNTIYLTFDCGYESGNMESILNTLKEKNVKATFFLVGNYLEKEPELVKRMVEEGHIIGNHTYHHKDMAALSPEEFEKEITSFDEKLSEIMGTEMETTFYRPPQGKYSVNNLKQAQKLGYKTIFWSLAYVDWYDDKQPTRDEAFEKLIPRIHPGAILLLHSTSTTNKEILPELIDKYTEMGYTFQSLDTLK